jgi:molybdopterin synthase sulfur carrier subunit
MNSLSVKLFARARDLAGSPVAELPWSDGETVIALKQRLIERFPDLKPLVPRLLVAVNNNYASDDCALKTTDEVACFPPVSGG